jgi:hypothetical protein
MTEYKGIRAWGEMLHSYEYYIRIQIEEARADKAPEDAVFKRQDGTWATYKDITNEETRAALDKLFKPLNVP